MSSLLNIFSNTEPWELLFSCDITTELKEKSLQGFVKN